ncbi:MAG TPA: hypothetical protein VES88_09980 [Gemmatimonadaceae bacterium]|nr:hypothetical protein [Gemmatimonadaceae bacterium]
MPKTVERGRKRRRAERKVTALPGGTTQQLTRFPISDLRLDSRNPRLPEDVQAATQPDLLRFIVDEYEPIEIANSIARHGYFPSEPIIVIQEAGEKVVVEGNRRLAAMMLLVDRGAAGKLGISDSDEWDAIKITGTIPSEIPAVVANSRDDVAPILGFRHISGIEPWNPWAQARFLGTFIDKDKKSFAETASLVGENERAVRESYRNYRAARQMKKMAINTRGVIDHFGVFTRALQDTGVREFLDVPTGWQVKSRSDPLPKTPASKKKAKEFVSWVFGDSKHEPLFSDSRKIPELGKVLSSPQGLAELRKTRDLEAAFSIAGGIKERLLSRLAKASSSLQQAEIDIADYRADEDVMAILDDCEEYLRALREND